MLTAFIEEETELATLEPQDTPWGNDYTPEFCRQDALLAAREESNAEVESLWNAAEMTPDKAFDRCMYMLESRWPPSYLEAEYRASRWLVARRSLDSRLWDRYVAAEMSNVKSADVEMREACGRAWMKAGLHHIGKHMQPPRHRHHSEKQKARKQRRRERPQENSSIRLWLDPQLKAERAAENGGIMRGTLR